VCVEWVKMNCMVFRSGMWLGGWKSVADHGNKPSQEGVRLHVVFVVNLVM
jgi:hypothetical protein